LRPRAPRPLSERGSAAAQDVIKIGACLSLTGGFQTVGRQALAGRQALHAAQWRQGRRQEDRADRARGHGRARRRAPRRAGDDRQRQGHIVLGGITPTALALGQLVTQAEDPDVVIISGASDHDRPLAVHDRTSFTLGQSSMIMGDWAAKNGSKKVVSLVNDWAPGRRGRDRLRQRFTAGRRAGDRES
jgi:branched-chain amino acid transport system substrate-binding protein